MFQPVWLWEKAAGRRRDKVAKLVARICAAKGGQLYVHGKGGGKQKISVFTVPAPGAFRNGTGGLRFTYEKIYIKNILKIFVIPLIFALKLVWWI